MTWPVPKFDYGDRVRLLVMENINARVSDVHFYGQLRTVEYNVIYYADNRQHNIRVFEDELEKL
jgi:hypothetical protein